MREPSVSTMLAVVVACMALAPSARASSQAGTTCHELNLSPTAVTDCEQQLGAALTDADRAKVIHTFAVGLATTKADALIAQLQASSSTPPAAAAPATPAAPTASATTPSGTTPTTTSTTQNLATPEEKETTAGGGQRTGTKAGSQHTQTGADATPGSAKAKAQKTAHQPEVKSAKKPGR